MSHRNKREPTALWNNEGSSYVTTNSEFYTPKEVPKLKLIKRDYGDQLWILGYEEKDMMYRRQKVLDPGQVKTRPEIEGPIPESTYNHDFADTENWKRSFDSERKGRIKRTPVTMNTGLTYGSEEFNEYSKIPRKSNRREIHVVMLNEEYKCHGIQRFRDVIERKVDPSRDQALLSKKVEAGLTTPIA